MELTEKQKTKLITIALILTIIEIIIVIWYFFLIPPWERIANEVANSRTYEANVFDCDDFSKLLIEKLTANGYKAKMELSNDAKNGFCTKHKWFYEKKLKREMWCHAWVILYLGEEEIHIEATTGTIADKNYYYSK